MINPPLFFQKVASCTFVAPVLILRDMKLQSLSRLVTFVANPPVVQDGVDLLEGVTLFFSD